MVLATAIVKELKIEHADGAYSYIATAAHTPGDVITRPDGSLAIVDGLYNVAIGDLFTPRPVFCEQTAVGVCDTAATWAAGDQLYWDATNNRVTEVSTGNTKLGRSIDAKTAGMTKIHLVVTQR